MSTIVTRAGKGSPLTNTEVDSNFTNLNTDKAELSGAAFTGAITTNSTIDGRDVAADGVTADAALPKAGGAMTGAITTNSTFDGVDIATRDAVLTSTTTTANAALPKAGGAVTGDISFGDSDKAIFGAGSDLQIYHNGSHSFLSNTTGNMYIQDDGYVEIGSQSGEVYIGAVKDGAVNLRYDNVTKLATTSTGIDVTGTATMDGLTVDGSGGRQYINNGHLRLSDDYNLEWGGGTNFIRGNNSSGAMSLTATGNLTLDVAGNINLDADGGGIALKDGGTQYGLIFKNSNDLEIYSHVQDGDIKLRGNDGGSGIVALTLDMSAAGAATFNSSVTASTSMLVGDGEAYGFGDNSYRIEGKDDGANARIGFVTGGSERMRITSAGNVGIGTSSPATDLHIKNAGATQLLLESGNTDTGFLLFGDAEDLNIGSVSYNHSDNSMRFETDDSERMRIDSSGRVGIGRTPSISNSKLEVGGADNVSLINVEASGVTGGMGIGSTGLQFFHGSSAKMRIDSSGRVGIGTSSPSYPLDVSGSAGDVVRFTGDANNSMRAYLGSGYQIFQCVNSGTTNQFGYGGGSFYVQTSGTERMRIDSSGNVMVGKTGLDASVAGTEIRPNLTAITSAGDTPLYLRRTTNDGEIINFKGKDGTAVGSIGAHSSSLQIGTSNTQIKFSDAEDSFYVVNAAGVARDNSHDLGKTGARFKGLYLSGGVYLGGTGAANKLDDYEEGTWTPAFSGASTNTGASSSGSYVKIGQLVHCTFNIVQTALTGTGTATMTGLPFACANLSNVSAFSVQDCGHTLNTVSTNNGRFRCVANTGSLQGVKSLGSTTYMQYNELYDGSGELNMSGHFTYRST